MLGLLRSAWLGQGLDRCSQQPPCPGSPDVSGEDKKQLRIPIEGFGELYEGLGGGPLDLALLDPADLRSREAAPPCQSTHREARPHARLLGHLAHIVTGCIVAKVYRCLYRQSNTCVCLRCHQSLLPKATLGRFRRFWMDTRARSALSSLTR